MTSDQLNVALRAYSRRRPFRSFFLELFSGTQLLVSHPEAVDFKADLYLLRRADGGYQTFADTSVCLIGDGPTKSPGP